MVVVEEVEGGKEEQQLSPSTSILSSSPDFTPDMASVWGFFLVLGMAPRCILTLSRMFLLTFHGSITDCY